MEEHVSFLEQDRTCPTCLCAFKLRGKLPVMTRQVLGVGIGKSPESLSFKKEERRELKTA